MRVKETICCFIFGLWVLDANAVNLQKLYEYSVPVVDQSTEKRKEGFASAFYNVLIAITGDRNITMKDSIQPLLANPDRFVKQFRYQAAPQGVQPVVGQPPGQPEQPGQLLWVQFDQNAVSAAMRSAGECIWASRQDILVWIGVEDNARRRIISSQEHHDLRDKLSEVAARRGLPLMYPLYDMQDQAQVKSSDIWGNFPAPILTASRRYRAGGVMVGRVSRRFGNNWEGRWSLYENNNVDQWTSMGTTMEDTFYGGVNKAADMVSERYKKRFCEGNVDHSIVVTVIGIQNMQYFAKAKSYLESLQSVATVDVEGIQADKVEFKLSLRGTPDDLNRTLERDARMVPVAGSPDEQSDTGPKYRFLP